MRQDDINEIKTDRKLLDSILEKYGKEDVMHFLNVNFDDEEESYFDTFSKADNQIKFSEDLYNEAGNTARSLVKEWQTKWFSEYVHKELFQHGFYKDVWGSWKPNNWKTFKAFEFLHKVMNSFVIPYSNMIFYGDTAGSYGMLMEIYRKIDQYYAKCDKFPAFIEKWNASHRYGNPEYIEDFVRKRFACWGNGDDAASWEPLVGFVNRIIIYLCIFRCLMKMNIFKPFTLDTDKCWSDEQLKKLTCWTWESKDYIHNYTVWMRSGGIFAGGGYSDVEQAGIQMDGKKYPAVKPSAIESYRSFAAGTIAYPAFGDLLNRELTVKNRSYCEASTLSFWFERLKEFKKKYFPGVSRI